MSKKNHVILLSAIFLLALALRTIGLFRGLPQGVIFHPDSPKQVVALNNYLHGQYVWYVGNLFYDGYPYGLNHVDEWIIRPATFIARKIREHTTPGWDQQNPVAGSNHQENEVPDRDTAPDLMALYYWARALRVFYSMIVLLCVYWIARKIGLDRSAATLALLLLAIAPLSITVAHFATGDVGVDLMTALALLCAAAYAGKPQQPILLLATGLFIGLGFAAKFQGLLVGYVLLVFLFMSDIWAQRRYKRFLAHSLLILAGLAIGIAAATPELFIDWTRSIHNKIANFGFIANYKVSEEFLQKSFIERAFICFKTQGPPVLSALGWILLIAALIGIVVAIKRARKTRHEASRARSIALFCSALFTFPLVAVLLSLAGKPNVQPFHFSYLQLPFTLAAVYGIDALWRSKSGGPKALALLLIIGTLLELGIKTGHECFFWQKEDNATIGVTLSKSLTRSDDKCPGNPEFLKSLRLEGQNMTAFRNRGGNIVVPRGAFWRSIIAAPVPTIPFQNEYDWIFANGPILPRNDRSFLVKNGATETRRIVFEEPPANLTIGLRSATRPTRVNLKIGHHKTQVILDPNAQTLINVPDSALRPGWLAKHFSKDPLNIPIRVSANGGETWVTILDQPAALAYYQLFGGAGEGITLPKLKIPAKDIAQQVDCAYYIGGDNLSGKILYEGQHEFLFRYAPLPSGTYRLTCEIFPLTPDCTIGVTQPTIFSEIDPEAPLAQPIDIGNMTYTVLTQTFSKAFAPFQYKAGIKCVKGKCMLGTWALQPDTSAILDDLRTHGYEAFTRHPPKLPANTPDKFAGVRFGNGIELIHADFPETLTANEPIYVNVAMRLTKYPLSHFGNYAVFFHLLGSDGKQVGTTDFPLYKAMYSTDVQYPIMCRALGNIPPGEYEVWLGIYNGRTLRRMNIKNPKGKNYPIDHSRIRIGRTTIKAN